MTDNGLMRIESSGSERERFVEEYRDPDDPIGVVLA